MSSRGRGSLFNLTTEGSSSSGSTGTEKTGVKDSGIGESKNSSGEFRRTGRGKLLDDLASSCSSLSIGQGRASLFKSLRSESAELETSAPKNNLGRGSLFTKSFEVREEKPKQEETTVNEPQENINENFFKPKKRQGADGTDVQLSCNYIQLECEKNMGVFVYEVRFSPSVDSFDLRMKYLNEHQNKLGSTKTFDGVILYLPILLENKLTTCISKSASDNSDIEIRIMYKKQEVLKDCMHLYNVLFNKVMKTLKYVQFDRKQFDPTAPKIIPQAQLEVWPGYVTAVDEYDGGLMLCCDVSHRVLCQTTVLESLTEIYRKDPNRFKDNAKKALLGTVVITRYNNRTYRIDDIYFDQTPNSKFEVKGNAVSYSLYYKKNYGIEIKDNAQPLLASIKTQRKSEKSKTEEFVFCLIPELCYLTGLRDEMRSDLRLMREIATFTRVSPNQRLLALQKFYENVNKSPQAHQILKNWGLSLKGYQRNVTGRQLREEQIFFSKKTISAGPNADFSKYATCNEMLEVINFRNWLILHCKNNTKEVKSFCEHMERASGALGMNNQPPKIVVLENDRIDTYVNALRANITSNTQIVVCICPTSRDDRYAAIKKLCCTEIPVPSQVINGRTLSNETKNRSICQKIALQMNCKLGGTLWSVKIPFKSVMICGIDSYHDAAQKGNSVAAFVASLNTSYTKWYSKAVLQTKREEIVGGLCSAFIAALYAYRKENKTLPDSVIIYRDGVGDGQLPMCSNYEVPQFENAVKTAFPNVSLKITFIVVQKRINTKYFKISNDGEANNPQPGTVLDHTVTRRNMYDFFLVSQFVRQGTVTPTHFVVLRDDSNFEPDIIQRLSYKLCFLYYNWPGTIRIPACCQYAHKMAYLIGQSVRRIPAEELLDKLFYL